MKALAAVLHQRVILTWNVDKLHFTALTRTCLAPTASRIIRCRWPGEVAYSRRLPRVEPLDATLIRYPKTPSAATSFFLPQITKHLISDHKPLLIAVNGFYPTFRPGNRPGTRSRAIHDKPNRPKRRCVDSKDNSGTSQDVDFSPIISLI